jgi:hypothetical protein
MMDHYPVLQAKDLDDTMMDPTDMVDEDPARHQEARNGDHLMCPFQCNECHFVNVHKCSSRFGVPQDELCLVAI